MHIFNYELDEYYSCTVYELYHNVTSSYCITDTDQFNFDKFLNELCSISPSSQSDKFNFFKLNNELSSSAFRMPI